MFNKDALKKMFYFSKQNRTVIKLGIWIAIQTIFIYIYYPIIMEQVYNSAIPSKKYNMVIFLAFLLIICIIVRFIMCTISERIRKKHYHSMDVELKMSLFKSIQYSKISEIEKYQIGNLVEKSTNMTMEAAKLYIWNAIGALCVRLLQIILICIMIIILNVKLGLITLFILLIAYLITLPLYYKTGKVSKRIQQLLINIQEKINEYYDSFITNKTLRIEELNLNEITKELEKCKQELLNSNKIMLLHNTIFSLLSFLAIIAVLAVGGIDLSTGLIGSGIILLTVDYIDEIVRIFASLVDHIHGFIYRYNCFANILTAIYIKKEDTSKITKINQIRSITFDNVGMRYDDNKQVLKNISFSINEPKTIAIVGKSGTGKTTLVNLIPKFYEINEGNIYFNNINQKEININCFRNRIAYVFQEPVIFDMSIIDNIKVGINKDINIQEIEKVCKDVGLHEKIMSLPNKYDTIINIKSDYLSYGEKQLLNYVRALLKDSDIIILDEVTSNLDLEYEDKIINSTKKLLKNKISFIIAHRLNTIKNADMIIYLKNGEISECGNHTELMSNKKDYYNLFKN